MSASSYLRGGGLAALAATLPLVAPAAAGASTTSDQISVFQPYCSTHELTADQLAAGETAQIECFSTLSASLRAVGIEAPADTTVEGLMASGAASGSGVAAIHYKSASGTGEYLSVAGDGCDGGGLSFTAGDNWNDAIMATRHRLCSQIKHYSDAGYSGAIQTTNGGNGAMVALSSPVARQVSSIRYQGAMNL
jgi:hypothetical protein